MHRTTIMLPRDLKVRAERRAGEAGISLGEFVRRSVERSVGRPDEVAEDPLFGDDAVHEEGGPPDYAARHDDYLYGDGLDGDGE